MVFWSAASFSLLLLIALINFSTLCDEWLVDRSQPSPSAATCTRQVSARLSYRLPANEHKRCGPHRRHAHAGRVRRLLLLHSVQPQALEAIGHLRLVLRTTDAVKYANGLHKHS